MIRHITFIYLFIGYTTQLSSVTPNVTFVNTGAMSVYGPGTGLYVPDDMRQLSVAGRDVKIVLNGVIELGGNFYHDAHTNVFELGANSTNTTSTGAFRFVGNHSSQKRAITTLSEDITSFDRGMHYIAFPYIQIATNDTIEVPARMGIDAIELHRYFPGNGYLLLKSEEIGGRVYNASLRFPFDFSSPIRAPQKLLSQKTQQTGTEVSEQTVDAGAVIVEQFVKTYRTGTQLFAFATPFKDTQYSGYFAGNWVRKPTADGQFGHTTYVLGNKPNSTNPTVIDNSQYVINPITTLTAGQAYLVKPRPSGYDYNLLKSNNGLAVTGETASAYDTDRFVFNGRVYALPGYDEQVFAEDALFSKTIPANTTLGNTVNWLIGNSYTSPISTRLLAQEMENSSLKFLNTMYVFPAGSTSYQPYTITGTGDEIVVTDIDEIPSMSVFMLRLSKGQTTPADATFTISKSMLRHGNASHGNPIQIRSKAPISNNQLIFRLSPLNNDKIYDLAAIGLRAKANMGADEYDIAKIYNGGNEGFQLYTLSETNSKLSANGVPVDAEKVKLCVKPPTESSTYKLDVTGAQTLNAEGAWLHDLATGLIIDLREQPQYVFNTKTTDTAERFLVYFKKPVSTKTDVSQVVSIQYFDQKVRIINLNQADTGSVVSIYDLQGRLVVSDVIRTYPVQELKTETVPGVYILSIKGVRNVTGKILCQ